MQINPDDSAPALLCPECRQPLDVSCGYCQARANDQAYSAWCEDHRQRAEDEGRRRAHLATNHPGLLWVEDTFHTEVGWWEDGDEEGGPDGSVGCKARIMGYDLSGRAHLDPKEAERLFLRAVAEFFQDFAKEANGLAEET